MLATLNTKYYNYNKSIVNAGEKRTPARHSADTSRNITSDYYCAVLSGVRCSESSHCRYSVCELAAVQCRVPTHSIIMVRIRIRPGWLQTMWLMSPRLDPGATLTAQCGAELMVDC